MSFTTGYDPTALAPKIIIKDLNGVIQFTYESPQIAASPTQDFILVGGLLEVGVNTDHGGFTFSIRDDGQVLIDKTTPDQASKIRQGWQVELFLGKDSSSLTLWFTGIVNLIKTNFQTETTTIEITTLGYGSLVAFRYSQMNRTQQRLADGETFDPADLTTKNSELFKDVLTDTDHLAVPGLGLLDITATDVEDLPFTLGDYIKNLVTLGSELNELAQMVGCYWGVDQNKNAFLRLRGSQSLGLLITNDVAKSLLTENWDQSNLGFMKNQNLIRKDSSQDSAVNIVHGVGSQRPVLDHNEQSSNAVLDLSVTNYAFPFIPQLDNVARVALFLVRGGIITNSLHVSIVGSDSSGDPDFTDIRETKIITAAALEVLLDPATSRFVDIKFNKISVTKDVKLFLVVEKSANTDLFLTAEYETGSGEYFISSDLSTWSTNVGEPKFITYQHKTVRIIGINTVAAKSLRAKETLVTLPDTPDENTVLGIFESILEQKSKTVVNFDPILITPVTTPLEVGKTIRMINVDSGFDKEIDLVGFKLEINAYNKNTLGASEITVFLQDVNV